MSSWEAGARAARKNPADMPVLFERYAVGDQAAARKAGECWRFGPNAWRSPHDVWEPASIQQQAQAQIPIETVLKPWVVGSSPDDHINTVQELFDSGPTIVNIHSGQPEQRRVVEFCGSQVLPKLRQPA
jgi:F420-dependent hydroxymycolic acid dehydrogenase